MAGKGRSPCCDKTKVKRGPWSPSEDWKLMGFIQKHGHSNWRALPQQAGLLRCGKSCRLRWINYLRPDVKRGNFSLEEEETIINLHESMGNKWSKIASYLPGRTDNEIKNVWNTHLKKRLGRNVDQNRSKGSSTSRSSSPSASSSSCISYGDMNLDKGPGNHEAPEPLAGRTNEQEQDPQFSIPIMLAEYKPMEESLSSGHSSASSNVQSLISVEEASMPMQEEPTTLIYSNTTSQVQNSMTTEAEQQAKASDEKIEIPFDSDVDFWSLLGALSPLRQPCEVQAQEPEVSKPESTDFGEVAEYKKWLKYLESELGLAEGTENDYPEKDAEEELLMKALENDLMFNPEVHAASSMWPSPPPQDFGI